MVNRVKKDSQNIRLVFSVTGPEPNDFEMGFTETLVSDIPNGFYNITAYAFDGYEFVSLKGRARPDTQVIEFIVSEDGLTAEYKKFEFDDNWTNSLSFPDEDIILRESEKPKPDYLGFNHVYSMTPQQLIDFTKERFTVGEIERPIDLGQYVINILELPFKIDEALLGSIINIIVGNISMTTQGTEVLSDEIKINVGSITIPPTFNNGYDYVSTNVLLHLPFSKTVELPLEYTINQTITVEYIVNLYTGDTTLNVRSSKVNDVIFFSTTFKLGRNIPFIKTTGSQEVIGTQQPSTPVNNGLFKAFIEVVRNKPHGIDNPFNETTSEEVRLGDVKGYVKVDDFNVTTVATLKEYEYIKSILKEGVLIK